MGNLKSEEYSVGPLAHMIDVLFMPDTDVSERVDRTYRTGARKMMEHLMSGELRPQHHNPEQDEFMGEFLGRVIANARRQGFEIPAVAPGEE
jgi:hypothetical protein